MLTTYHSFSELPTPDETSEAIGYTTDGQVEAERTELNGADDDKCCKALYQEFTVEKHPRNRWDMALWACSYDDWKFDYGAKYSGPYADRTGEMYRLHDAFIEKYLMSRDHRGWRNKNGSEIKNPLVDVLDAFEAWRKTELSKPAAERACEFGADGFPVKTGQFEAFIEAVKCGTACYFDDCLDYMHVYYDRLAIRGLVPDLHDVRNLPPPVAVGHELCVHLAGIDNDEELLPPGVVEYLKGMQTGATIWNDEWTAEHEDCSIAEDLDGELREKYFALKESEASESTPSEGKEAK